MGRAWTSLSRIIDWALPPTIVAYSCWGLYLSVFHVGLGWIGCHNKRAAFAGLHIAFSAITISAIIGLILFLWTIPFDHDTPPRTEYDAAQAWYNQFPRECRDKTGALARCNRDDCGGRAKPPRTHHCSVCQVCRMEWDHHCPWVGSCLTIRQSKAFLLLLLASAFGVLAMAAPVMRPVLNDVRAMYITSRSNPRFNRLWWDWWGSWLVFGGPGGRWVLGTVLGYWVAGGRIPYNPNQCQYGQPFMTPTLSTALTLVVALCLSGFCSLLAFQMGFRLLKGQTTIEALQNGGLVRKHDASTARFLWLPSVSPTLPDEASLVTTRSGAEMDDEGIRHRASTNSESVHHCGTTFLVPPESRVYDLGIRENIKLFWRRPLFYDTILQTRFREPPKVNPDLIRLAKYSQNEI